MRAFLHVSFHLPKHPSLAAHPRHDCLQELRASHNQLSGTIPPSLGELRSLALFALDNNNIGSSIPDELGMLSRRLQTLHLARRGPSGGLYAARGGTCNATATGRQVTRQLLVFK